MEFQEADEQGKIMIVNSLLACVPASSSITRRYPRSLHAQIQRSRDAWKAPCAHLDSRRRVVQRIGNCATTSSSAFATCFHRTCGPKSSAQEPSCYPGLSRPGQRRFECAPEPAR